MKVGIACDHAGYEMKEHIKKTLTTKGHELVDFGTNSSESVDYPDYAHLLAQAIENGEVTYGISICYSGNGINMTMNKYRHIRAALCWNEEVASLARHHNNANACSLPSHFISMDEAVRIVAVFLTEEFDSGRHQRRIDKMPVA